MDPALSADQKAFTRILLRWDTGKNDRQMPWKGEKDPYKIWLSEIILQQTRVEQGWDYYNRFVGAFPTVQQLAAAPDDRVFKLWEGLGYYSRCRNLLHTARYIAKECKGVFPQSYDEIKALKGIGPYTAAAISSFAYDLPHAVVDGNVFRVLARVFGIRKITDSTDGKKYFTALAETLLDKKEPGRYNQAIMDFGAVICKPLAPLCRQCVFQKKCKAFLQNKTGEYPVRQKKMTIRQRWFYFIVPEYRGKWAIRQRTEKDIWQGLFEFPLLETVNESTVQSILKEAEKKNWLQKGTYTIEYVSPPVKHQLTHQLIRAIFIRVRCQKKPRQSWIWTESGTTRSHAFPRIITRFLETME